MADTLTLPSNLTPPPKKPVASPFSTTGLSANNFGGTSQGYTPSTSAPAPTQYAPLTFGANNQVTGGGQAVPQVSTVGTSFQPTPASQAISGQYVKVNPKGGTAFSTGTSQTSTSRPSLDSYLINGYSTPNGGTYTAGQGGGMGTFTPGGGYSIDTSGSVPSNALTSGNSMSGLNKNYTNYQDLVNGVSQAQGYSPGYIQALQQQYQTQGQGAALGFNQAQYGLNSSVINANLATGAGLQGYTQDQGQAITGQQQTMNTLGQSQNTLQQAQNSIQQLAANQALNTQQLSRTGAISAAQTQLQYSPTGMAGSQAISQYQQLQQQYPNAQIPPFDPHQDPIQQYNMAREMVAQSSAYQAGFQSTYTLPGGGTGIYNKLNTSAFQQNPDGTVTLVSGASAAQGGAQAGALADATATYNKLNPAFQAANSDFSAMINFMQKANINNAGIPIVDQLQNAVGAGLVQPGVIGAFNAYVQSLRTNYGNVLGARGETPSQAGANAVDLIPDKLKPSDMQLIQTALNINGQNVLNSTLQTMNSLTASLGSGTTQTQSPTETTNTSTLPGSFASGTGWR